MQRNCYSGLFALAFAVACVVTARADFAFTNNGHAYTLFTTARTWEAAQSNAVARGGSLARIDDATENDYILTNLLGKGITTTASDGGSSIYVWIGGRETVEGTYGWTNRDSSLSPFWFGGKTGTVTNGLYANWGSGTNGSSGPEPDNFAGTQNRAGFALEAWPKSGSPKIGQPGQWNDISSNNALAYLVETSLTPPIAVSNLTITVTSPTNVTLAWRDASTDEYGFRIWYLQGVSGSWILLGNMVPNSTNLSLSGLQVATPYQFAVGAYDTNGSYLAPPTAAVTMPGLAITRDFAPAVVGQPFSFTLTASSDGGAPDSSSVTGTLPPGLFLNSGTRQITGTPTNGGVFPLSLSVHYPTWGSFTKPLTVRVIYPPGPPVVTAPIPAQTLATNGPAATVPLNSFFADRDTEKAARFVTSKGNFDLALYATATPQTVSNFLNYVSRGAYSNSIVHRAVTNFVVQGGGFKPAPPNFTAIPTDPSPTNEPGVQHIRGTVAMAKQGGNPNSATDQWFVNLKDNSSTLDDQNSGFTAFGRVCSNGLAVLDATAALPTGSYPVNVDGVTNTMSDWPMDTAPPAPAAMDQSKLVLVNSVTKIEPLAYTLTGISVTGLVSAAIVGTNLVLTPTSLFGGRTVFTVTATDLDGNSVSQTVTSEVATAYSTWQNQFALQGTNSTPDADPEGDFLRNAVEFALMGSPLVSDAASILPTGSTVITNSQTYAALSFRLRKNLSGATVLMQAASALTNGAWTTVWTSADLAGAQVMQRVDGGDHWRLTVRDNTPTSLAAPRRFLRLLVSVPR